MKKLESLTPAQAARIPEWIDKWTKIGLSCEPNDIEGTLEILMKTNDRTFLWPTCPSGRVCPPMAVPHDIQTCEQASRWRLAMDGCRVVART